MKAPQHVIDLFKAGKRHDARLIMADLIEAEGDTFETNFVTGVDPAVGGDTMPLDAAQGGIGWPLGIDKHVAFFIDASSSDLCVIPRYMLTPGSYDANEIPPMDNDQMAGIVKQHTEARSFETMIEECRGVFTDEQMDALYRFIQRHGDALIGTGKGDVLIVKPYFNFGSADFRKPAPDALPSLGLAWVPEHDVDRTDFGPKVAEDKYFEAFVGVNTRIVPKFAITRKLPPVAPHDVHGPRDVPKLRNYMLDQWRPDKPFFKMAYLQATMSPDFGKVRKEHVAFLAGFIRTEIDLLRKANLWWVSEEMVDILTATAPAVPNDVTVNNLVLPSPAGFTVFEKPIYGSDSVDSERKVIVNAIAWGITEIAPTVGRPEPTTVLSISAYRRIDFDDGLGPEELADAIQSGLINEADRVGAERIANDMKVILHGVTWAYIGRSDWPVGDELNQTAASDVTEEQMLSFIEDRRLMAAFLTLIQQEAMADIDYQPIARPERRRAERTGVPREANDLRVVTLRKKFRNVVEDDGTEPVESTGRVYSHRWLVNPFYRWQKVGKGRTERRLTLVRGHVKGPEDKPLKIKQEVKAWVR